MLETLDISTVVLPWDNFTSTASALESDTANGLRLIKWEIVERQLMAAFARPHCQIDRMHAAVYVTAGLWYISFESKLYSRDNARAGF